MLRVTRIIFLMVLALFVLQQAVWATGTAGSASTLVLTQAEVEDLIKQMDKAIDEKSIEIIDPLLYDELKVTLKNVPQADGKTLNMEMTKNQYLAMAKQTWATAKSYEYRRTDLQIDVAKDGKSATVSAIVHEKVVMPEQALESKTREVMTVEKRDGKVVATALEGEVLEMK